MSAVAVLHNRMTDAEFDQERAKLRATYGDSSTEAAAKRDQAMALLFARSNWTQEELAKRVGKSQTWVAQALQFGRFLNFIEISINPESAPKNLKQSHFLTYWKEADSFGGNERMRFAAVQKAMQSALAVVKPRMSLDIGPKIIAEFADGKWHTPETVAAFIDASLDDANSVLERIIKNKTYNCRAEKRKYGKGHQYRIFKQDKLVATSELRTKLQPIIDGLKAEGRKNSGTVVIAEIARSAVLLLRLLDEWEQ